MSNPFIFSVIFLQNVTCNTSDWKFSLISAQNPLFFPDSKVFSLIEAENPLFFPDFPDWKKLSNFPPNSLIGGNPASVGVQAGRCISGGGGLTSQDLTNQNVGDVQHS